MLWQRLLFGSVMLVVLVGLIGLDAWVSARVDADVDAVGRLWCGLPSTLLVLLLAVLASLEMGRLCSAGGYKPATFWAAFIAAGLTLLPWIEMQTRGSQEEAMTTALPLARFGLPLTVFWLTGGTLGACLAVLARKTTQQAVSSIAITLFIFLYAGLLASFAVRIRCLWAGPAGAAALVYFLLTVKSSDIGAYFTGMALGRHKLAPWVSPGKTVEGALGAIVMAAAVAAGGMLLWPKLIGASASPPLSLLQALVFGTLMAIAGQLGDLVESAVKRDVGSKDSGAVVPAFGGILDIVDSPLFTAPIAWWLLTFWAKMS